MPTKILRLIWHPVAIILIYAIVGFLHLMRTIKPVTLLLVSEGRIGAFAARADFYLRQRQTANGAHHQGIWLSVIDRPANQQLLRMLQRHMPIVRSKMWTLIMRHNMSRGRPFTNVLKSSRFFYRLPYPPIGEPECYESPPVLSFTDSEEARGQELLERMGIPQGSWFVCFIARDNAYFDQAFPGRSQTSTNHRNSSISNYVDAMKYVVSCGGYAVRMGAAASVRLPDLDDPRFIDYAFDYRSDFGDIYLPAKCKFFVGGESGLNAVPLMFNVPVVDVNVFTMRVIPLNDYVHVLGLGRRDLFIPRPIYSTSKERLLTFRDILGSEVRFFQEAHKHEEIGLQPQESSPEDILDLVKEMNERLDGQYSYTEEDEALQYRFRSLIQPQPENFNTLARVGAAFLRTHRDLLE